MTKACAYCGTTVLFGGARVDDRRYCNSACAEKGERGRVAQALPEDVVQRAMGEVLEGNCPVCAGPGPVDVFTSHRALSALVVTTWKSIPRLSCRGCATRAQLGGVVYSLFLGWWGFPWGLVMTPVQIVRNLIGLSHEASREAPSPLLERMVRERLAAAVPSEDATKRSA